ncbi:alpha/beta fold hydrolase [Enterovirga aerilata]|uniref:Alpha/beta fold hydrolase n=1 Tax=Enterovirga aerilata TaxID=2730920 RepID=A0A849I3P3_9HYPH|nr:alpha/beta hydrolase [Enterovirga sp. DB1703]NNM71978.1 alpha/beta fold hydrolase [Enterovirga sp. DB1703]
MHAGWVPLAGRRLYCFETGKGPPVVLLHGMANAGIAWRSQVTALAGAGFRVIVPDMVAHGASDPIDRRPVTVPDLVSDLVAVLDHFGVEKADLVGVSMGGTVSLASAVEAPERVNRLVVVNAGPSTAVPEFQAMLSKWAATLRGEDGPSKLLDELWSFSVNEEFSESDEGRQTYQLWHAIAAKVDGPAMAHVVEGVAGFDITGRLPAIAAETLFLGGGADPAAAQMRALSAAPPNARYDEVPGAKHLANVDEAKAFTQRLLRFLQ